MSFLGKFRNRREYILKYKADVLVMGDDWKDKFNDICRIKRPLRDQFTWSVKF